jgi:transcriptional regulator with XRE-family HTH domain
MANAKKFLEQLVGPMSIGKLIRAYRVSHELTLQELADKLGVTRGFVSNIEMERKPLSLDKTLEIAKKLKESTDLYASVWFETQAREAGLDFKKIINKMAS